MQEWLSLSTLFDAPIFNIPTGVVNSEPGKSSSMIKAVEDQKKIHRLSNSSTIATLYQTHTQHHHQTPIFDESQSKVWFSWRWEKSRDILVALNPELLDFRVSNTCTTSAHGARTTTRSTTTSSLSFPHQATPRNNGQNNSNYEKCIYNENKRPAPDNARILEKIWRVSV